MVDVLNQLQGANSAAPAVRKPVFEVSFAAGGGGESPLGGLASAASALGVNLGGQTDPWKQSVIAIYLEAGLAPAVDAAQIYLMAGDQSPTVALGDAGSISLGYEDSSAELVFTGQIDSIRYSVEGVTLITATNGGATLSKLRINKSYEQQSAGDVVKDLTGGVEVATDSIDDGVDFPYLILDDRSNAYTHIAALARKSGLVAFFTPEGKLNAAPFEAAEPAQKFTYGVDILSLRATDAAATIGSVKTVGEGAASSEGQDAWSWFIKDASSVTGQSGSDSPERGLQDASLRSGDAAQKAADGLVNAASMLKVTGSLLVPGAAAVKVGSTIEVADAPQEKLNGRFLVRSIRHRFSKSDGFTSLIVFCKAGEGGSGGFGGLL